MKKYKLKNNCIFAEPAPENPSLPYEPIINVCTCEGTKLEMFQEDFEELFEEIVEEPHIPHDWGAENPM